MQWETVNRVKYRYSRFEPQHTQSKIPGDTLYDTVQLREDRHSSYLLTRRDTSSKSIEYTTRDNEKLFHISSSLQSSTKQQYVSALLELDKIVTSVPLSPKQIQVFGFIPVVMRCFYDRILSSYRVCTF